MDGKAMRDLIDRFFAALEAHEGPALESLLAPDIVYDPAHGGRTVGRDAFRRAMAEQASSLAAVFADRALMVAAEGHRAAVECTMRGVYRRSLDGLPEARGQSFSLPAGVFFELENGRIARVSIFVRERDWLQQLGNR